MNNKPSMSKRAIRVATGVALVAALAVVAASLLMSGAGGATAFNAGGSESTARHSGQVARQCSSGTPVAHTTRNPGLVADCATLLAAKDALEGTSGSLNWSAAVSIGDWDGVGIGADGVASLRLSEQRLNGAIPAELGNLANLTSLDLSVNQLTGGIPPELGNLANLTRLDLRQNRLTGAIPSSLGVLVNLTRLELSVNQLTGTIPAELGNLDNLTRLELSGNQLTGDIPAELGELDNLQGLYLSGNQLTGELPAELGELDYLSDLYLSGNQLRGDIPTELSELYYLQGLYLNGNQLTGELPPELGRLSNLMWLYLNGNGLAGDIPPELGNLANLARLELSGNELTGAIPAELGNLANLQSLHLSGNRLTGEIPAELDDLPYLVELRLSGNRLAGCVPASLRAALGGRELDLLDLPICDEGMATATPTPTPTRAPVTPIPTTTPTATPVSHEALVSKVMALEARLAEHASRLAALEIASAITPPTPTPTATPTPTPTSVAGASDGACVERLPGSGRVSVSGRWAADCVSANPPDNRPYYARFYTFTVNAGLEATITLSSDDASPYLFLLEGEGTGGAIKRQTGADGATSVAITASLGAGDYTIEASAYDSETGGEFTLEVEVGR